MNHVALCVASLCFPLLAVAAPAVKEKPAYYYPTREGDTCVYETRNGHRTSESTSVVKAIEVRGDNLLVTTKSRSGDGEGPSMTVEVSSRGLATVATAGRALPRPYQFVRLPARAGESWTFEPGAASVPRRKYTTVGEEEVEVPAGKFQALRIDYEASSGEEQVTTGSTWIAPGVGLVKSASKEPRGGGAVIVLKSFTSGK